VIGWYYPDEWDAFLQSTVTRKELDKSIPPPHPGRISFLTLTNHFYSLATPLPQGKGMYPLLMSIPDVVGFDLYPLAGVVPAGVRRRDGRAARAAHDVRRQADVPVDRNGADGTTMQGGEATRSDARDGAGRDVARIAGGAAAIGYFPNRWSAPIGDEITRTTARSRH
jgi:hypothetical protein